MQRTMVDALNLALDEALERDPDVLAHQADVGVNGGVFRVTKDLRQKHGEKRVRDTPLAECGIVGTAVGMAISGLKPVVEIQFSGFTMQAFDQIEQNMARFRNRSRNRYPVSMVMRTPYGGGIRAVEHHSESREAYWAHTPGLKVVIPSGPRNARALLHAAINDPDPVVFLEPKRLYRSLREDVTVLRSYEGQTISGTVTILNCAKNPSGTYRYGVRCVPGAGRGTLHQGLGAICAELQRKQLARLAGRS